MPNDAAPFSALVQPPLCVLRVSAFEPVSGFNHPVPVQLGQTSTNMQTQLNKIIEELQRNAKVCETVAQDKTEEALTAESVDSETNAQEAKEWTIKSKVWLEAEAVVRGFLPVATPSGDGPVLPSGEPVPAPLRPATGT